MAESIGDMLRDGTMTLVTSNHFEGLDQLIIKFMAKFSEPDQLGTLVMYLPKVDIEQRFSLLNQVMNGCKPEGFPSENTRLWNAMMSMIHHALLYTGNPVPTDEQMASILDQAKTGEDPFKLLPN